MVCTRISVIYFRLCCGVSVLCSLLFTISYFLRYRVAYRMMVVFSRNKCQKIGVVSKQVSVKPCFLRKHAPSGMSLYEMYQYYTGCSNGLQMDCFDTRFVESRSKWELSLIHI